MKTAKMNGQTFFLFMLIWQVTKQSDRGFDDTILYSLNWPGELVENEGATGESIVVTSAHQEKYKCTLPTTAEENAQLEETYDGPTALELLSPLFSHNTPCSFRLESYWTYQVCHGRKIRQYHEDREGKTMRLQEYVIGKWDDPNHYEILLERAKENEKDRRTPAPVKKIDNVNLPYYEIVMENGTQCTLKNNNKPRMTKVLYVCYIHGKHEIYSVDEPQSCVYEIIILSPLLCSHPKYKPKESGENKINCVPLGNSYKMPYSLAKLQYDSALLRKKSDLDRFKVELIKFDKEEPVLNIEPKLLDSTPVESFLRGKNCLHGGTSWWKFEFCYGKSVEQYHIEKDGRKVSINLGIFDKKAHLDWISENPHKRPKPLVQRKQLSHLYASGSTCEKTGKPRQTEVKLKCLQNPSSPNAVSLYLLEPKICQYILGVESPLICDILSRADDDGLVEIDGTEFEDIEKTATVNIGL